MFRTKCFSIGIRAAMLAIVMMMFLPINSFAQRRWVVERSRRSRIVVYQPRPYVVYQRRPYYTYRYQTYSYPSSYYTTGYDGYDTYSYPSPSYSTGYYSYRYSQPYVANRYTYSWANPTYRYDTYGYRPRYRHNRVRVWWR
jgi:hypothetical protein